VDLKRLEVFCKVVELKSFTRAAEAVALSQPTVSENIRLLEETLGEKLLDRLGREVLPTGAGRILYRYARRILQLRDEAIQAVEQYRGELSGVLHLGASTIPGAYILPERIVAFKKKYPAIRTTVKIAGTGRIVEELLQGGVELGIIGARSKDHHLDCEELFSDELVLVVYPGHPWTGRKAIPLEELEGQPIILREEGSGSRLAAAQALSEAGFDPSRLSAVAEMGSTEAVRQGVKAGIGIAILSCLAVTEDLRQAALCSVPIEGLRIRRSFYLARRKGRQLSPLAMAFLEHIRKTEDSRFKTED
jgi:DNA-binding transcriptional LysR family regulator